MQIYANKLGGDVEIINGLNHYIGMNTIHEKDFVEFIVLPYLIAALAIFGLLSAIINRKWFFLAWYIFLLLFGVVAMTDFYIWEYNYGHNLDPNAAIKVPGMAYQPPLIGYKQLLNFAAYSMPDSGGWIFVVVGICLTGCTVLELRNKRKNQPPYNKLPLLIALASLLSSCNSDPKEIPYGQASCEHCKMTIMDKRFGCELVTPKGKAYFFDDLSCLTNYTKGKQGGETETGEKYVADYGGSGKLIPLHLAILIDSPSAHGPMGGTIIAFENDKDAEAYLDKHPGKLVETTINQ